MIFITHPEHGADNISDSDLADREKADWRVTSRDEWMAGKNAPSKAPAVSDETAPVRNKPGRKAKAQ